MDRTIRKMKKIELLELLLEQEQEIEKLKTEIDELRKKLEFRQIQINESGSIAEAALRLSDIFESAQKAADIYLQSVKAGTENAENTETQQDTESSVSVGDQNRTDAAEEQEKKE